MSEIDLSEVDKSSQQIGDHETISVSRSFCVRFISPAQFVDSSGLFLEAALYGIELNSPSISDQYDTDLPACWKHDDQPVMASAVQMKYCSSGAFYYIFVYLYFCLFLFSIFQLVVSLPTSANLVLVGNRAEKVHYPQNIELSIPTI